MYVSRQFLRPGSGPDGDTALSFIRYSFPKDTLVGGREYRLLLEEELAYRNFDQGLAVFASRFAVRVSGDSVFANRLRPAGTAYGRLPLKPAAADTAAFAEERVTLIGGLLPGTRWMSLRPGPSGRGAEFTAYLGPGPVDWRRGDSAEAFAVSAPDQAHLRMFAWRRGGNTLFSSTAYASSPDGADSARVEEEYLGERDFTAADSEAVIRSVAGSR
jgi:hypothetical protein